MLAGADSIVWWGMEAVVCREDFVQAQIVGKTHLFPLWWGEDAGVFMACEGNKGCKGNTFFKELA